MNALARLIAARIRSDGPLSMADYMTDCLLHPRYGYYARQDPFGATGDFITAPEISQMFGELLGLSLAQAWLDQGQPSTFCLAELGPGRGTLMADILRATRSVPGFHTAARVYLMEASATLRTVQERTLSPYPVTWVQSVNELPDLPLFLVTNEFFDALPIRQYERQGDSWCERRVGLVGDIISPGKAPPAGVPELQRRLQDTVNGDIVELCAPARDIMEVISARIATFGGGALIVDYGGWHTLGDTFQALRNHAFTDPYLAPGECDLTAHVDFEPLAMAARSAGLRSPHPMPQGEFLERLGITARAQALAANMEEDALTTHIKAHHRLTHPSEMGTLFLVLGVSPLASPPLPGLRA